MSEWITDLVSDAVRNPLSKEPEITKQAELALPDPNYITGIDEQLSACRLEKESLLKMKARGDDVETDLKDVNNELDELLECRALATKETTNALQEKSELTSERLQDVVESFRVALATDFTNATCRLKAMYPDLNAAEINLAKEAYWEPIFGGDVQVEANLQGELVDSEFLGDVLDDLLVLEVKHPEFLDSHIENVFGITNASLKEELIRRAIETSPDLEHRDPEEIYQDPHLQQSGPHTSDPGMMPMAADEPGSTTEAPATSAPAPSTEDMVQHRVELQEKLSSMEDNLAKLREAMMRDLLPLQEKTKQEEPLLIEALRRVDGMQTTVGNWQAFLKTRAGYDKLNKAKLLDKITAVAQQEDERIYKLIKQLEGTKAYRTEVAPSENVEIKRVKESGLELEAAPQQVKEWWGRIKNWFTRTFCPQLEYTADAMEELGDYLNAVQSA